MWNKELYVREQQDAYEFFTSLVDQLDEHLKVLHTQLRNPTEKPAKKKLGSIHVLNNLTLNVSFLQKMGREQIFKNTFQGIYSDQKICKDCPHRSEAQSLPLQDFYFLFILVLKILMFPSADMSVRKHSWP